MGICRAECSLVAKACRSVMDDKLDDLMDAIESKNEDEVKKLGKKLCKKAWKRAQLAGVCGGGDSFVTWL